MSEKGLEQTEPQELDEKGKGRYRPPTRPAIVKDFDDEELIRGTVNFPANMYEALRKEASDRGDHGVTMGSIIREYVREGLAKGKEAQETGETKESPQKEEILELLKECYDEDWGTFKIEGENGFIAQVEERKLIAWTNDLLKETAEHYAIEFKDYEDPDLVSIIEKSSITMKLNPKQKKVWADLLKSEIESREKLKAERDAEF